MTGLVFPYRPSLVIKIPTPRLNILLSRKENSFSQLLPWLTSIKEKCLLYNFIYGDYGKNAYHTISIQNLKTVLKVFREKLLFYFHLLNLSAR